MSQVDSSIVTSAPASKAAPKAAKGKAATPTRSQQQAREIVTFETARRICPSEGVAAKISTEAPRVSRRQFRLSHAAIADCLFAA